MLRGVRSAVARAAGCAVRHRRRRQPARSRRLSKPIPRRAWPAGPRAARCRADGPGRRRRHAGALPSRHGARRSHPSRRASASACWRRWRSGTPVVVSRIAPFIEYLGEGDALFCDPYDPASIAAAMRAALRPDDGAAARARPRARRAGIRLARGRRAQPRRLSPPAGARRCLRCASSSAGPTAGGRAAIRLRSSSATIFARARAIRSTTSSPARARR